VTTTICSIANCQRPKRTRGMCPNHYARWLRTGDATLKYGHPETEVRCTFEGCDKPYYALGYCTTHHTRFKRWGDPAIKLNILGEGQAGFWRIFWERVDASGDCWQWTRQLTRDGYGRYHNKAAHRLAYIYLVESLTPDQTIDHLCRNRRCVNPDHFEIVSSVENVMRGFGVPAQNARKEVCSRGHPFDWFGKRQRYCSQCTKERKERKRLAVSTLKDENDRLRAGMRDALLRGCSAPDPRCGDPVHEAIRDLLRL
jgi:hypothetical protein